MAIPLFESRHAWFAGIAMLVSLLASATKAPDAGLKKLSPTTCTNLSQSVFKPTLPAAWQEFLPYTKVCALRKTANASVAVYLVSVFANDYYRANPSEKTWKPFPLPLLLAANGSCLAQVPEHYPNDEPRELNLFFGHWHNNIPTHITVSVSNPAVGGNYRLPALFWDETKQQFIANKSTDEHPTEETQCPL